MHLIFLRTFVCSCYRSIVRKRECRGRMPGTFPVERCCAEHRSWTSRRILQCHLCLNSKATDLICLDLKPGPNRTVKLSLLALDCLPVIKQPAGVLMERGHVSWERQRKGAGYKSAPCRSDPTEARIRSHPYFPHSENTHTHTKGCSIKIGRASCRERG